MTAIQQWLFGNSYVESDPEWLNVVAMLGGSLTDPKGSSITQESLPITTSSDQTKWNPLSLKVNDTGAGIVVENATFDTLNNHAWTLECWVYLTTTANGSFQFLGFRQKPTETNYLSFGWSAAGGSAPKYLWADTDAFGDQYDGYPSQQIPTAAWVHIALVRAAGSNLAPRIYMNGSYVGQLSSGYNLPVGSYLVVGAGRNTSGNNENAYIDEVRFTKDVERYTGTGSYTIPTAAFPRQ